MSPTTRARGGESTASASPTRAARPAPRGDREWQGEAGYVRSGDRVDQGRHEDQQAETMIRERIEELADADSRALMAHEYQSERLGNPGARCARARHHA